MNHYTHAHENRKTSYTVNSTQNKFTVNTLNSTLLRVHKTTNYFYNEYQQRNVSLCVDIGRLHFLTWIFAETFAQLKLRSKYSQTRLISHRLTLQSTYCHINFYPRPAPVVIKGH